ncbi:hypothetical protein LTR97_009016 [Elasticomyces elasticus]|uniref:F-box domain-containing protein n=1 Tax=Elasticomyces elasticus TaxID=574655 RepID=A0AAN8A025_9PEZI|nr:hypothetical protein LTR97_009016 [Elasticomyces elasticus]
MDRLPNELVDVIAAKCDFPSLKNLRLVNKVTKDAATPLVFGHFYMGYFPDHLDNLCKLAKSPLAKEVKVFTLFSDLLPNWTEEKWRDQVDLRPECYESYEWCRAQQIEPQYLPDCGFCTDGGTCAECRGCYLGDAYAALPRHHFDDEQLFEVWTRFRTLRESQAAWREDREGIVFQEYFSLLPSLTEARVVCAAIQYHRCAKRAPVWERLRKEICVSPDDWNYDWTEGDERFTGIAEGQPPLCLLEAVGFRAQFAGTTHISKLMVQNTYRKSYMDRLGTTVGQGGNNRHLCESPTYARRYLNVLEGFKHITALKLEIVGSIPVEPQVMIEICTILRTATQLRRLELSFLDDYELLMGGVVHTKALSDSFCGEHDDSIQHAKESQPLYWPHLEHMALRTNITPDPFVSFLRRHAATLRSLELRDMSVDDATDLLKEIPKVLKLDHVHIEKIYGVNTKYDASDEDSYPFICYLRDGTSCPDDYEKNLRAYLLGQAEKLPELREHGRGGKPKWTTILAEDVESGSDEDQ